MRAACGFLHVRGAAAAAVFVAALCALAAAFPAVSIGVSVRAGLPARGVGTPEICSLIAASSLSALTRPRFFGAERWAPPSRRAVHALYTGAVACAPALPVLAWYARLRPSEVGQTLPPVAGSLGTPIILGSVGVLAALLGGLAWSVLAPPLIFATIVLSQHLDPGGVSTAVFATAKEWHLSWPLVAGLAALAVLVAYRRGSLPRR